jgi:hypothetical protein
MPSISYPTVLTPANWDKQKGLIAKAKPTGIGEALKTLAKTHGELEFSQFEPARLKSAAEVSERLSQITSSAKKKFDSAVQQAKTVETLARKAEAEFKKNALIPKTATQAAGAVAKGASDYAAELEKATQSGMAALDKLLSELKAAEKKKGGEEEDESDAPAGKVVRNKVIAALRAVKANKPEAKVQQFMIGVGKTQCCAYMGLSVSASHKNLLMKVMEGDSGFKFYTGECIWEAKAYTFVGDNIPTGGFAKKLQKGLFDLTGTRYKLRVRKTDGEAEEAEGDDEEQPVQTGSVERVATTSAAELSARHAALKAGLDRLIAKGGPQAAALKQMLDEFKAALVGKKLDAAASVLVRMEETVWAVTGGGMPSVKAMPPGVKPRSSGAPQPQEGPEVVPQDLRDQRNALVAQLDAALNAAKTDIDSLTGLPTTKDKLAKEHTLLAGTKPQTEKLAASAAVAVLPDIVKRAQALQAKAAKARADGSTAVLNLKNWATDPVATLKTLVERQPANAKTVMQPQVAALQKQLTEAQAKIDAADFAGANKISEAVFFAAAGVTRAVNAFAADYPAYKVERDKADTAIKALQKHAQASAIGAEIREIESRLKDADELAIKATNNGWKKALIAVKPLPALCARAKGLADRLAAAAAKLPVLTKKFKDAGADDTTAAKMAGYAHKLLVEENCSDDDAVKMAKDANDYVSEGLDEQDAVMSSRVKRSLETAGVDATKAKAIGRNIRAGGTSNGDDAKAVAKGMSKMSTKVLDNLNKAGIQTECCRGPATEVLADLAGEQPRGWPDGMTWDSVPGCYSPSTKKVVVGTMASGGSRKVPGPGEGPIPHGTPDLIGHEAGHAFDASDGTLKSTNAKFLEARTKDITTGRPAGMYGPRDNYFLTTAEGGTNNAGSTSETFAESFAMHFAGNSRWPDLETFWGANPWGV